MGVVVTITLGLLSSLLMAVLFHPGTDPSRIYYGTDTRLFDLMAGATLAFLAASRPQPSASARRTLHAVAPVAAAVLAVFWVTAGTPGGLPTNFMFEGGFLICAALAALVIADARLIEPGWFSRALAWPPLHFIGTISYGIYLWHWPVIVYLSASRTGLPTLSLDIVRVLVTLALSIGSYYLVERPIRLARPGGLVRWWGAPLAGVLTRGPHRGRDDSGRRRSVQGRGDVAPRQHDGAGQRARGRGICRAEAHRPGCGADRGRSAPGHADRRFGDG